MNDNPRRKIGTDQTIVGWVAKERQDDKKQNYPLVVEDENEIQFWGFVADKGRGASGGHTQGPYVRIWRDGNNLHMEIRVATEKESVDRYGGIVIYRGPACPDKQDIIDFYSQMVAEELAKDAADGR